MEILLPTTHRFWWHLGRTKSPVKRGTAIERKIRSAVIEIYKELADALIKDAEGATKKITIKVVQAKTEKQAESVAFTVAESPLVKTADVWKMMLTGEEYFLLLDAHLKLMMFLKLPYI